MCNEKNVVSCLLPDTHSAAYGSRSIFNLKSYYSRNTFHKAGAAIGGDSSDDLGHAN